MTAEAIIVLVVASLLLGGGLAASILNIARKPEERNVPTDVPAPAD